MYSHFILCTLFSSQYRIYVVWGAKDSSSKKEDDFLCHLKIYIIKLKKGLTPTLL